MDSPNHTPPQSPIPIDSADPRLRIMISSTTFDLPDHRKQATEAVQRQGHTAVVMEHGTAECHSETDAFSMDSVRKFASGASITAFR